MTGAAWMLAAAKEGARYGLMNVARRILAKLFSQVLLKREVSGDFPDCDNMKKCIQCYYVVCLCIMCTESESSSSNKLSEMVLFTSSLLSTEVVPPETLRRVFSKATS